MMSLVVGTLLVFYFLVVGATLPSRLATPVTVYNASMLRKDGKAEVLSRKIEMIFYITRNRFEVSVLPSISNNSLSFAQIFFKDGEEGYSRPALDYYFQKLPREDRLWRLGILDIAFNSTPAPRPPDAPAPSHPRAACVINAPTHTMFRKRLANVLAVGEERLVQLGDTALGGGRSNYTYTFTDAPNNRTASHHEIFMTLASAHMLPVLSHLIDVKSVSCNASAERVLATTAVMYNFTLPNQTDPVGFVERLAEALGVNSDNVTLVSVLRRDDDDNLTTVIIALSTNRSSWRTIVHLMDKAQRKDEYCSRQSVQWLPLLGAFVFIGVSAVGAVAGYSTYRKCRRDRSDSASMHLLVN